MQNTVRKNNICTKGLFCFGKKYIDFFFHFIYMYIYIYRAECFTKQKQDTKGQRQPKYVQQLY